MTILKPKAKKDYNKREQVCNTLFKKVCLPLLGLVLVIGIVGSGMEKYEKFQAEKAKQHEMLVMHAENFKKNPMAVKKRLTGYLLTGQLEKIEESYRQLALVEDKGLERIHLVALSELNRKNKRKKALQHQFSPYDGSHYQLERYLKKYLKDPSSYEHIETRYIDKKDYLIVTTQYRAKNGFGGMAIGTIKVKVNLDGDILNVISAS